ncbi:MAG: hypothetical protein ACMZ7B_07545 [Balneola sp.]
MKKVICYVFATMLSISSLIAQDASSESPIEYLNALNEKVSSYDAIEINLSYLSEGNKDETSLSDGTIIIKGNEYYMKVDNFITIQTSNSFYFFDNSDVNRIGECELFIQDIPEEQIPFLKLFPINVSKFDYHFLNELSTPEYFVIDLIPNYIDQTDSNAIRFRLFFDTEKKELFRFIEIKDDISIIADEIKFTSNPDLSEFSFIYGNENRLCDGDMNFVDLREF